MPIVVYFSSMNQHSELQNDEKYRNRKLFLEKYFYRFSVHLYSSNKLKSKRWYIVEIWFLKFKPKISAKKFWKFWIFIKTKGTSGVTAEPILFYFDELSARWYHYVVKCIVVLWCELIQSGPDCSRTYKNFGTSENFNITEKLNIWYFVISRDGVAEEMDYPSWRSRHFINDSFIVLKIKNQIMESSFLTWVTCQPLAMSPIALPRYEVMQSTCLFSFVPIRKGYVNQSRNVIYSTSLCVCHHNIPVDRGWPRSIAVWMINSELFWCSHSGYRNSIQNFDLILRHYDD